MPPRQGPDAGQPLGARILGHLLPQFGVGLDPFGNVETGGDEINDFASIVADRHDREIDGDETAATHH